MYTHIHCEVYMCRLLEREEENQISANIIVQRADEKTTQLVWKPNSEAFVPETRNVYENETMVSGWNKGSVYWFVALNGRGLDCAQSGGGTAVWLDEDETLRSSIVSPHLGPGSVFLTKRHYSPSPCSGGQRMWMLSKANREADWESHQIKQFLL